MALISPSRGAWGWGLALLAGLAIIPIAGLIYRLQMPGQTHREPLPPLSTEETRIRERLATQVQTLAGYIGERNLWRYEALVAAAHSVEGTLRGLGYAPEHEGFASRGHRVRNLIAERRGSTRPEEIVLVGAHDERIRAMFSLETIGYYSAVPGSQGYPYPLGLFDPDRANFIGLVGNLGSRALVRCALGTFRHTTAFYRYSHYRTAEDTPQCIHYDRSARMVAGLAPVVADLAAED